MEQKVKIYTYKNEPFMLGPPLHRPIATEIEDYELINFGKGYVGVLVKNTEKERWHMCLKDCGAMIGTNTNKTALISQIINDIVIGDEEIMKEQFDKAMVEIKNAEVISNKKFFMMFK